MEREAKAKRPKNTGKDGRVMNKIPTLPPT
jgi:hypothetical protein